MDGTYRGSVPRFFCRFSFFCVVWCSLAGGFGSEKKKTDGLMHVFGCFTRREIFLFHAHVVCWVFLTRRCILAFLQ